MNTDTLQVQIKEKDPRKTALYEEHFKLKAKLVDFAGWLMPIYYSNVTDEHLAVRTDVGIFDISHMGEIKVSGKDAYKYLQKIITNDLTKIKDNKIIYTPMCNNNGGVIDDLLVYQITKEEFFLVVNASNIKKDYQWLCENIDGEDVHVSNLSNNFGAIAVQGPKAADLMKRILKDKLDVDSLKYFHFKEIKLNDHYCIISRTGYTGEDGFEIYASEIVSVWQALLQEGAQYQVKPIGLGARDTLRLEMAYSLYGHDLRDDITPIESGIGWTVVFDKGDFIGKKALLEKKDKSRYTLVGFELTGRGIPREHCFIKKEDQSIGEVSSGTFSPSLKKGIGLAFIKSKILAEQIGKEKNIEVEIRGKNIPAKIVSLPFFKIKNIKK